MLQGHAFQILHDNECMALMLPNLVDCTDVGVIQSRGRSRFPAETLESLRISGHIRKQEFQGTKRPSSVSSAL